MCSVSFPNHLGSVPKKRNGSAPRVFVDLRTQIPALRQFLRLLNGIQGYLLSHSPHPVDGAHNRFDRPLLITVPQASCPCSSCVEQTTIPFLGQLHRRNHLPVDQEVLQPPPLARPGDHRNISLQGHARGYNYRSSVSFFLEVPPLWVICILPVTQLDDTRMVSALVLLIFSPFGLIIIFVVHGFAGSTWVS